MSEPPADSAPADWSRDLLVRVGLALAAKFCALALLWLLFFRSGTA